MTYSINDWMDPGTPVDVELAQRQWQTLVDTYRDLGHHVHLIDPVPGLPDMVFVTDSGVVVDGVALGARYRTEQRGPEAAHVLRWFEENGLRRIVAPNYVNEGEGDLLVVGDMIFAGTGFRTDERAHAEAEWHLRRRVATVRLTDPRYYHLNTAMGVLDDHTIAYLPSAFDDRSVTLLRAMFPDAIIATEDDTRFLGLNLVSDGHNVVLASQATGLAEQVRSRGYNPVPVDMSEFLKSGGGIKCCTLELRGWTPPAPAERIQP
ncbi:dimethylargininase [Rhodococcus sp. NPDC003318]|uniref:dimethylargininase n=1 Tax=Rhodococcus sp. NPDC003318 TaxID=3364503 RepID=UPI0036794E10